jgi:MFS-type transporter involved in bile tolerance (Atg22 family)
MLIMSNIFMSTSLLYLAKDAAGCFDEPIADGQCNKSIYGMKAESFITNIATIAAVLAALFMPICGALVDYTPHRKLVGVVTALLMVAIQAAQIGTVEQTWFAMGLLQALAAFIYQLQLVVLFAYMPEIARQVGEVSMTKISSNLCFVQFASSTLFLIAMTGITIAFNTSAVVSGQISQGLNTVTSMITFAVGWFKYLTPRPAVRAVPEGHWLLLEGFNQNWRTAKSVQKHYKHGLRYFLLAVVFAEACT